MLACFFLSGFSSLVYQVTWIRKLILIFGSTTFAVSTVLTVFMGGLALGSFLAGRLGHRIRRGPVAYGIMEIGIGIYGFLIAPIFVSLSSVYQGIWDVFHPSFYSLSLIRLVLTSCVLLIPTTLMGATLPVLSKYYSFHLEKIGLKVGRLYSINTFGAVVGTFLAGFVLLPGLGIFLTILVAGVVNFILGGAAILAGRGQEIVQPSAASAATEVEPALGGNTVRGKLPALLAVMLITFAISGFAAMVFEVAWTRALSLILGSTTYAFSTMLTTFLIGLALGSYLAARIVDRLRDPVRLLAFVLLFAGITTYAGLFAFNVLPSIFFWLFGRVALKQSYIVLAQFLISFCVLILPTLALGAIFPLIVKVYARRAGELGRIVGNVYSANTVGAIVGSLLAGFVLIPVIGAMNSILVGVAMEVVLGYVLLSSFSLWQGKIRTTAVGLALLAFVVAGFWRPPHWSNEAVLAFDTLGRANFTKEDYHLTNHEVVFYRDGATATVAVGKRANSYYLAINGRINASDEGDMPTQVMLAQFPLLLAPKIERLLIIGWGSGVSVGSAAQYPPSLVKSIKAVELERAVIEGSRFFEHVNNHPLKDPRVEVVIDDGRNYLQLGRQKYDVIVSEPSHPWMTGVSNLFTKDFFEIVKSHLTEDGVFSQWLQTYQLSAPNIKVLVRTFREVFPYTLAFVVPDDVSDLILIGSRKPILIDVERVRERMGIESIRRDLERVDVKSPDDVVALLRMGTDEMYWYGARSLLNTDDNAFIEFAAPKDLYTSSSQENSDEIEALGYNLRRYVVSSPTHNSTGRQK